MKWLLAATLLSFYLPAIAQTQPPRPLKHQVITYSRRFLFDKSVFGRRRLKALNLDNWKSGRVSVAGLDYQFNQQRTREGLVVNLMGHGQAEAVNVFFQQFVDKVISSLWLKWGFRWRDPSLPYIKYWYSVSSSVQQDIHYEAIAVFLNGLTLEQRASSDVCQVLLTGFDF